MPLFACHCRDGPDGANLRSRHLAAHLAHVEAYIDRYAVAGPLKDADTTVGSLLVIKADSSEHAAKFLARDPYTVAGVWERIDIAELRAVAGEWVGGVAWRT